MRTLHDWILARLVPDWRNTADHQVRMRYGDVEGWISIVINTLLFVVKGGLGWTTGSVSLIADAWHTLSDSVTSAVVVLGFRIARQPADSRHPFGHGRMEAISTLIIAVLLGVVALEMLTSSVRRILHPQLVPASWFVIIVLLLSIVVKEWLARFSRDLGQRIQSDTLIADFWHHRSDVIATALVVVAFLGARWQIAWLDGAMGIGVSAIIAWAAYRIIVDALGPLLGEPASPEAYRQIEAIARQVDGVRDVHDILVHRYGPTMIISLHVEVPHRYSLSESHAMSERIEDALGARFPGHAVVHVDPVDQGHPRYAEIQAAVSEFVRQDLRLASFHDLRVSTEGADTRAMLDITLRPGLREGEADRARDLLAQRLSDRCSPISLHIDVEPLCMYDPRAYRSTAALPGSETPASRAP